jgi:two-component system invasion response regulator UvrY
MNGIKPKLRILIVDDHAVFRHGLKDILSRHFPEPSFGEADSAPEALEHVNHQSWDIVILDINLPGRSGIEILYDVRQLRPKLPVLVLSQHPEEQYAIPMLKAGAAGYINKVRAAEDLVTAVTRVLAGGKYITPSAAEELVKQMRSGARSAPHRALSTREFQVLQLTVDGKPGKAIAAELSLSLQTISTYRTRVFKKLGVRNNVELVRYALENRLVERLSKSRR